MVLIKVTDAERTENLQKNVYPLMEVVSVAVNVDAEVVLVLSHINR